MEKQATEPSHHHSAGTTTLVRWQDYFRRIAEQSAAHSAPFSSSGQLRSDPPYFSSAFSCPASAHNRPIGSENFHADRGGMPIRSCNSSGPAPATLRMDAGALGEVGGRRGQGPVVPLGSQVYFHGTCIVQYHSFYT